MMSLKYFHLANRYNLAAASWNFVVVWEYCIFVDEHVLDANLSLSADRCLVVAMVHASNAVVCFTSSVFDQCSRSAAVATCALSVINRECFHCFFHIKVVMRTRIVIHL